MDRRLETLLSHLRSSPVTTSCGSGLRYTVDQGILTAEQRLAYEKDGFLVVRGLVGQEQLDTYRERFKDICSSKIKVAFNVVQGGWSLLADPMHYVVPLTTAVKVWSSGQGNFFLAWSRGQGILQTFSFWSRQAT